MFTVVRPRRGVVVAAAASWLGLALWLAAPGLAQDDGPTVLHARVEGVITPVVASYLDDAVDRAEREGHEALLVTLDTPGGLDTSMRDIVKAFTNTRVPVIVYVSPPGARAASAGAVIALSAHVAAMAPGTNIGAATPVDLQGGEIGDKVVNDAAAYVRALAELRGRDPDFYEDTVREGRSEPASRALEIGAIDLIATDRDELFREVDEIPAGAVLVPHDLGFLRSVRQRLADPNIAFLFLSLGTLAIIYELANPGIGFGGIAGVIMIVLAFFSLAVLPVNVVGLVFLLLAVGLFVAELFVPGVGVFAGGGAVSLVLAGLFLFRGSIGVDLIVILPTVAVLGGGTILAGRLVWRARRAPSGTGTGMVAGRVTQVKQADGARGQVVIDGTWWRVRSTGVPLEAGQTVVVREMDGLELVVEPRTEEESA